MGVITGVKIKQTDDTYSEEIPIKVNPNNIEWDENHTLTEIINELSQQTHSLENCPKVYYGTTTSLNSAGVKIVNVNGDFQIEEGSYLVISFSQSVSASTTIYLDVNNTGAYPIYYKGGFKFSFFAPIIMIFRIRYYSSLSTWYYDVVGELNLSPDFPQRVIATDDYGRYITTGITVDELEKLQNVNKNIQTQFTEVKDSISQINKKLKPPTKDGIYVLKCVVVDGQVAYDWELEE